MTTTTVFIVLCGALLVNGAFLKRPHLNGRIIGGTDADIEEYPYQLSFTSEGNNFDLCGATIISEDWVLTSAVCVHAAYTDSIVFRAGSTFLSRGGSLHRAEEVIVHEKFVGGSDDYNFAVVRVNPPFSFGPGVQAIGLADTEPVTGEEAVITGWGTDKLSGNSFKEILQVTNVLISDRETCFNVTPRKICSAGVGGKDTCWGDNGGPLVVGGKLAGIGSYGGCGVAFYASTYSNVANQRDWIKSVSGI